MSVIDERLGEFKKLTNHFLETVYPFMWVNWLRDEKGIFFQIEG